MLVRDTDQHNVVVAAKLSVEFLRPKHMLVVNNQLNDEAPLRIVLRLLIHIVVFALWECFLIEHHKKFPDRL